MNTTTITTSAALTLGALLLSAPVATAQANDFTAGSAVDPTDWHDATNWSKGVVPSAPYSGAADFARMTTTDAVLSGTWYDQAPGFLPTDSGFGYNTNVAVGFQTTNKLTITGSGFLHSAHAGGIAVGKKSGGNGTIEIQSGGYLVSSGAGGIICGAADGTATGKVDVFGVARTSLVNLREAASSFTVKSGGKLEHYFPQSGWPELKIDGGATFTTNSNVGLLHTTVTNGVIDTFGGSQVWFRGTCDMTPTSLFNGVGGGKVLFDDTTTIDGIFMNDGPFDVRVGTDMVLGSGSSVSGMASTVWLRNDTSLKFEVDTAGTHAVFAGGAAGYDIRFGGNPELIVDFAVPPVTGSSHVLMTGVNDFKNWDGSQSGFEFGSHTVNGLAPGQAFDVVYDLANNQLVLDIGVDLFTDLGFGLAGALGVPQLDAFGPMTPGGLLNLDLTGAQPSASTFIVGGFGQLNLPLFGGTLVPTPDVVFPAVTDGGGDLSFSTTFPLTGTPAGVSLYAQCWVFDLTGPQGFAVSNAILGVTQ